MYPIMPQDSLVVSASVSPSNKLKSRITAEQQVDWPAELHSPKRLLGIVTAPQPPKAWRVLRQLIDGIAGTVIMPRATLVLSPKEPTEGSGNTEGAGTTAIQYVAT